MFYLRREMEERDARPLARGRARGRRRHVRPRRAHLRPHRDDRDGRHVLRRQPDLRRRSASARSSSSPSPMLGSLTVPARDALLPRREGLAREGPRAVRRQAPPHRPRASRASGARSSTASSSARSSRRVLAGGLLVALAHPRARHAHVQGPGRRRPARAATPVMQTYDRIQAAFPGGAVPAIDRRSRPTDVTAARGPGRDRSSCTTRRSPPASSSEPLDVEISPDKTVAVVALPVKGNGTDAASERSLDDAARRRRPGHGRQARRRRGRRDRHDRRLEGLQRRDEVAPADRVRVRARPRVHPAAGHVPLDRRPDQGDRAEPAVGRRRLRRPRARLPGRPRREAARLRVGRRRSRPGCRCSCS